MLPPIIELLADFFSLKIDKYTAGRTYTKKHYRGNRRFIPGYPGIYILCRDGIIEYIGQSQSISVRLSSGHKIFRQGQFTVYTLTEITDRDLRYGIEALLIGSIKPKLNEGLGFERIKDS